MWLDTSIYDMNYQCYCYFYSQYMIQYTKFMNQQQSRSIIYLLTATVLSIGQRSVVTCRNNERLDIKFGISSL